MNVARATILVLIATVAAAAVAHAASLTVAQGSVGAAWVASGRCTAAGLGIVPNLTGTNIVSVTVSSLPAACGNATLQLTVNNGTVNSSGSGTVPAAGGSLTITLGAATPVTTNVETDLVVIGP